jgi:multiple sugar transport system permease protein
VAAQQVLVPVRRGATRRTSPWVPWAFIAPNLVGMLAFTLVPVVSGLLISFTDWDVVSGLAGIRWVGLANFTELFADERFWRACGRTVLYTGVAVPVTTLLGLALAQALNRPLPGRGALRAIFFIPHIVNMIAIGTVWLLLLNPTSGLVNQGLRAAGLDDPPGWFISTTWALPALMLITVWGGIGYVAVIYLAALQNMPRDLHEAAMVDGAGAWRRFRAVTWPGLMPTTTFLGITAFIGYSQGFGLIAYLTAGGPGEATTVLSYYMYQNGFQYYRFGYAAAMGVMSFLGVLILTLLMWRYQRGRGLYT